MIDSGHLETLIADNGNCDGQISLEAAKELLNNKKSRVQNKWKVLISSALCCSRAIKTFDILWNSEHYNDKNNSASSKSSSSLSQIKTNDNNSSTSLKEAAIISILRKRLGDACNEIGKILLSVKEILQ